MKIVGIIGPYFNSGIRRLIDHSIADARFLAIKLASYFGYSKTIGFFVPHNHTAQFEVLAKAPEPYYHKLDETIFDRACDGFVLLPNWNTSSGSHRDYNRAVQQGRIIFKLEGFDVHSINSLIKQLEDWATCSCDSYHEKEENEKEEKKFFLPETKKNIILHSSYPIGADLREAIKKLNMKNMTIERAIEFLGEHTHLTILTDNDWLVLRETDGRHWRLIQFV